MMKTLNDYINESLLDDEDDVIMRDVDNAERSQVEEWLRKYAIFNNKSKMEIVRENDKFVVNADWLSISSSAPAIPTDLFTFGTVNNLEVFINLNWTDLRGCPKVVKKECYITGCDKLKSLKGGPEEVGNFIITSNVKLESLQYSPKIIKGNVNVSGCESLTSLEGLGKMKKTKELYCGKCKSLLTLKGAPKEVKSININGCTSLKSLDYMPFASNALYASDVNFSKDELLESQKIDKTNKLGSKFTLSYTETSSRMKTMEMFHR